ncbi:unnamed protein product [Dibothriocephalus latus]|uniref:RRM domain-containing protein n=1 Tax=Dibothriocephalus latus TaxID=60516 RepID=A0A3P7LTI6_DIBLA|nr:unnamed protein product [Dibothriocephalus latus]
MDLRPNHTLYVNNLNDKLGKTDLKRALYYLFSQHGRIIDIIAMKTPKMRGQAFIIYQNINSATSALRVLQGFQFFQKMEAAEAEPPNRVLFVSNLPEETTDAMLTMLFSQFSGFQEARRAVGGIGFVEYETENQATAAKAAYNEFKLTPTHAMTITYAKK